MLFRSILLHNLFVTTCADRVVGGGDAEMKNQNFCLQCDFISGHHSHLWNHHLHRCQIVTHDLAVARGLTEASRMV